MPRNKDIIDEKDFPPEDLVPIKSAPIVPGTGPGLPSVGAPPPLAAQPPLLGHYFEGSLPSDMQHDGYFIRTGYQSPQAASFALMPVAQVASQNAAVQSVSQIIVDEAISKIVFPASGLKWRGIWSIANVYSVNDLVQFNSSTYIALVTNSQVRPDTDITKWTLVSENFVFDANVITPGVIGFGPLDQIVPTNGTATPASSGLVNPAPNASFGLWVTSVPGGSAISSGWIDLGAVVGTGNLLVWQKSLTNGNSFTISETTTGRWAANLALFAAAGLPLTASITSVQITSNVVTLQCVSSFTVGTRLRCTDLVGASFLNAQTLVILSNTGTAITATFVHANYGPTAEGAGVATNYPFLQVNSVHLPSATSGNIVFTNPITAGSTIVVLYATNDLNANFPFTAVTDNHGAVYTISTTFSPGGLPANRPSSSVAVAQNVAAGATTVSVTASANNSGGGSDIFALELPGGGSAPVSTYLPYDVFQFRGSFFVCNTETTLDAFDDPTSWDIIAQGVGSVVPVTVNYQVLLADWGRLVYNNTTSNWNVTLPATVPPDGWMISVQALNTGTIVINPNGATINGTAGNITIVQNQGVMLYSDGAGYYTFRGFGTVFSVALSMPSIFSVAGSPVTGSGTFTVTLVNQNANLIFAGPASGAAAAPTFRQMVNADLPVGLLGRIAAATGVPGLDGLDGEPGEPGPPGQTGPAGSALAPGFVAINALAQTASVGTTTLYAVDASRAGMYRATVDLITTTAGAAGIVTADIIWNNGSAALTQTSAVLDLTGLGNEVAMVVDFYSAASVNISYSFTVVGLVGAQFSVRIRLEYLG